MKRTTRERIGALVGCSFLSAFVIASCGTSDGEVVVVTQPCAVSEECPDFTDCYAVEAAYIDVIVTDTLCTNPCTFDDECALGGKCVLVDVEPLCYARCLDDLDCWGGYGCVDWDLDFDPVCLPI